MAIISGKVLRDDDGDGTGDLGINYVTLELLNNQGTVIDSTTTDRLGSYRFKNLVAGDYQVRQINRPNYEDVSDSDGGDPNLIAVTVVNIKSL